MTEFLRTYSKAIGSAVTAGLTALAGVAAGGVTLNEFWLIVVAVAVGGGLVTGLPFNLGPGSVYGAPPVRRTGARRRGEAGVVSGNGVLTVVLIVAGVLACLWLAGEVFDFDLDITGDDGRRG